MDHKGHNWTILDHFGQFLTTLNYDGSLSSSWLSLFLLAPATAPRLPPPRTAALTWATPASPTAGPWWSCSVAANHSVATPALGTYSRRPSHKMGMGIGHHTPSVCRTRIKHFVMALEDKSSPKISNSNTHARTCLIIPSCDHVITLHTPQHRGAAIWVSATVTYSYRQGIHWTRVKASRNTLIQHMPTTLSYHLFGS